MNFCLVFLFAILGIAHVNGMRNQVTQEIRDEFVDMHNSYRSLLAEGLIDTETGVAGPAKKMKKMVYDMALEQSAKIAGNHPLHRRKTCTLSETKAGNKWWNEGFHMNQERDKSLYRTGFKMSSFANMAWDTRNKVGCAIVDCSGKTHVVCHYEEKDGENIYEIGQQCTGCSDYGSNVKCENDLCIA